MNLDKRETATVLAALRYFQAEGTTTIINMPQFNEGTDPLTGRQIDRLCERINTDHEQKIPIPKREHEYEAYNIHYDTDDGHYIRNLPAKVTFKAKSLQEAKLKGANIISDKTGWCVSAFQVRRKQHAPL
jgi:hypothetical protein